MGLSDQNFSPILPSVGSGNCLKITRVENADMLPMCSRFLQQYGSAVHEQDIINITPSTILVLQVFDSGLYMVQTTHHASVQTGHTPSIVTWS
jgi:hypothetical protein